MAHLGNLPAIPANLLCDEHGQDEAKDGQDGAQDGQDGAQDGQDKAQDGQDEAHLFHVRNSMISDMKQGDFLARKSVVPEKE